MNRTRARCSIIAFIVAVGGTAVSAPAQADIWTPPPLPKQPGTPVSACMPAPAVPGWTMLVHEEEQSDGSHPNYLLAVDPSTSCRMYRADNAQTLDRSTDTGRSWNPIFHDDATACAPAPIGCTVHSQPFNLSVLTVSSVGTVLLGEAGNGDAVVASDDGGTHWELRDDGLDGAAIDSIAVGPSDPRVAYVTVRPSPPAGLTVQPPSVPGLYCTTDGGASWAVRPLPTPPIPVEYTGALGQITHLATVQIDPADAGHLWVMWHKTGAPVILESHDQGRTWTSVSLPKGLVTQFMATRTATHGIRLYAVGTPVEAAGTSELATLMRSDDDGITWTYPPVPTLSSGSLGVDPADMTRMLYVGYDGSSVEAFATADGFDSLRHLAPPPVGAQPLLLGDIQADRFGNFYVGIGDVTSKGLYREAYWRFTPGTSTRDGSSVQATCSSGCSSQPPALPMPQLLSCGSLSPPGLSYSELFGTLAFDGVDLLYTQSGDHPSAITGVVHRLTPSITGCIHAPDTVIQVPLADTYAGAATPQELTYDPMHDRIWIAMTGADQTPIVTVSDLPGRTVLARPQFSVVPCDETTPGTSGSGFFSYDPSDDTLWSCRGQGSGLPALGHLRTTDGTSLPTCMSKVASAATWLLTRHNDLWVQGEDDSTIDEYHADSCTMVTTYLHRPFSEGNGENEQLACDPITFGDETPFNTTVMWIRDAVTQDFTAYVVPPGTCPFPTVIHLTAMPPVVSPGQPVTVCAQLALAGRDRVLANRPLTLRLPDGSVTSGVTGAQGQPLCILWTAALHPRSQEFLAWFAGTQSLLPSSASVAVTLLTAPMHQTVVAPRGGSPLPSVHDSPPPASTVQPQTLGVVPTTTLSVQAQTQLQTQAQTQVHTQSAAQGSAAFTAEREVQRQPARAVISDETRLARQQQTLSAVGRTLGPAGGALMLALALLPRRRVAAVSARAAPEPPAATRSSSRRR